jgi:hypothetical protein
MTPRDENDLTDAELQEMWEEGQPVEVQRVRLRTESAWLRELAPNTGVTTANPTFRLGRDDQVREPSEALPDTSSAAIAS